MHKDESMNHPNVPDNSVRTSMQQTEKDDAYFMSDQQHLLSLIRLMWRLAASAWGRTRENCYHPPTGWRMYGAMWLVHMEEHNKKLEQIWHFNISYVFFCLCRKYVMMSWCNQMWRASYTVNKDSQTLLYMHLATLTLHTGGLSLLAQFHLRHSLPWCLFSLSNIAVWKDFIAALGTQYNICPPERRSSVPQPLIHLLSPYLSSGHSNFQMGHCRCL